MNLKHININRWSAAKDFSTAGCCTSGDCTTTPTTPAWSAPRTGGWSTAGPGYTARPRQVETRLCHGWSRDDGQQRGSARHSRTIG